MNTFDNNLELETLKAQMSVLKNHLSNETIISDELVNATISAKTKSITYNKKNYLRAIIISLAMAALFSLQFLVKDGASLTFTALTVAWCLLFAVINFINYRRNDQENLMSGSLTETAKNIIAWRKRHSIQNIIAALAAAIWVPACLIEFWDGMLEKPESAIIVALIFGFVFYTTISKYIKSRKTSKEILNQIEALNK